MTDTAAGSRHAGILVPLFSLASSRGWGIGDIADLEPMARWLEAAGHRVLQILPINEMPSGETSPYSALSAMAIDPQFIALDRLEDFEAIGGEASLDAQQRSRLDAARVSPRIDYTTVRDLKTHALRRSFAHFREREWSSGTRRSGALKAFVADQAWWIDDFALYRALHAHHGEASWTDWPEPLRSRAPHALAEVRAALADEILFRQYLQWVAGDQWASARQAVGTVRLFGDMPFMVGFDSADVWARQDDFRMDASIGVPPDAFSETGQDWGLPVYRWSAIAERGFEWLKQRARRNADLFDGYRVDHLVGFYRTYARPHDGREASFDPADQADQIALGERVLSTLRDAGAEIVAEDLGVVPDFVRASLARLAVPGYKVFRWEREWNEEGQPFKDPAGYPAISVATSGTHDTEPMVIWWEQAPREEREAVLATPSVARHLAAEDIVNAIDGPTLSRSVHEALVAALYASGSNHLCMPIGDLFNWRDRINQPGTVSDANWTWKMPWPIERLAFEPEAVSRATQLKAWCEGCGR